MDMNTHNVTNISEEHNTLLFNPQIHSSRIPVTARNNTIKFYRVKSVWWKCCCLIKAQTVFSLLFCVLIIHLMCIDRNKQSVTLIIYNAFRKLPCTEKKVLELMSTTIYTGLNPFNFIHERYELHCVEVQVFLKTFQQTAPALNQCTIAFSNNVFS
jgi:hypothetical protein